MMPVVTTSAGESLEGSDFAEILDGRGGDATGAPTAAKARAWGSDDRVHVVDRGRAWVWRVEIGPALLAASSGERVPGS